MICTWLEQQIARVHERRGLSISIVVLRMLIGFAFIPAGLKKLLGQPFTVSPAARPVVNMRLWSGCGWLILLLYFGNTAITGQVYRPMGAEWSNPSFIVLLIIAILPVVTFALDSKASKRETS